MVKKYIYFQIHIEFVFSYKTPFIVEILLACSLSYIEKILEQISTFKSFTIAEYSVIIFNLSQTDINVL